MTTQRKFSLGQAWVTRVTSEVGPESPAVQGPGAIERPDELVRFALDLAVATLGEEGCNCHPEEPCALCMCREAIFHLDAYAVAKGRCEGRYPVPPTAPPRDEPFPVTYRCDKTKGHDGPHGSEF